MTGLSGDCIALPAGPDRWILYNVRTRTSLGVDGAALAAAGSIAEHAERLCDQEHFNVWDVGWFSQTGGSVDDPTRLRRDPVQWGLPRRIDGASLYGELTARWLIVTDNDAYDSIFDRPRHPLQFDKMGNFHDQLGRHLLVDQRVDPSEWWVAQKFRSDGAVRADNAYGTVQWPALTRYFDARIRPGMQILDVGCGTGVYSAEMGRRGADVLGIDPSSKYVALASARRADRCRFAQVPLDDGKGLVGVPDTSADLVFMSDALLFSFVPLSRNQSPDPHVILRDIRRVLRPRGVFASVEPHGDFYLSPWMGDPEHPWTVMTEHRGRRFSTAPVFPILAEAVLSAGFKMAHVEELYRADECRSGDARADAFVDEFPFWILSEYVKGERT